MATERREFLVGRAPGAGGRDSAAARRPRSPHRGLLGVLALLTAAFALAAPASGAASPPDSARPRGTAPTPGAAVSAAVLSASDEGVVTFGHAVVITFASRAGGTPLTAQPVSLCGLPRSGPVSCAWLVTDQDGRASRSVSVTQLTLYVAFYPRSNSPDWALTNPVLVRPAGRTPRLALSVQRVPTGGTHAVRASGTLVADGGQPVAGAPLVLCGVSGPAHQCISMVTDKSGTARATVTAGNVTTFLLGFRGYPPLLAPALAGPVVVKVPPAGWPRFKVLIYGDSLAWESFPDMAAQVQAAGAVLSEHTFPMMAICDYLPGMAELIAAERPDAVVLAFQGGRYTPCMRDAAGEPLAGQALLDKYRGDATAAIKIAAADGARTFLASGPVFRDDSVQLKIADVYADVARTHPGVGFIPSGESVAPNGRYVDRLPCESYDAGHCDPDGTVVVRSDDGIHFCPGVGGARRPCPTWSSGEHRYATALAGPPLRALGLR